MTCCRVSASKPTDEVAAAEDAVADGIAVVGDRLVVVVERTASECDRAVVDRKSFLVEYGGAGATSGGYPAQTLARLPVESAVVSPALPVSRIGS